jgi:hypothetical protein
VCVTNPFGEVAHERGADAHGGRGGDVRQHVGGQEEVDGVGVRDEVHAHGVVHDHGEPVGAEGDGRAREPAHVLPDRPDVAELLVPELGGHLGVRDVISSDGSPDRFLDLRRVLIGGGCRFVTVSPPHAAPYKREVSRGTGTNVHRAHSAATNPNLRPINRGAEARGLAPPRLCDRRPTTPTDHRRPDSDRRPSPWRPPHRPKVSSRNP